MVIVSFYSGPLFQLRFADRQMTPQLQGLVWSGLVFSLGFLFCKTNLAIARWSHDL